MAVIFHRIRAVILISAPWLIVLLYSNMGPWIWLLFLSPNSLARLSQSQLKCRMRPKVLLLLRRWACRPFWVFLLPLPRLLQSQLQFRMRPKLLLLRLLPLPRRDPERRRLPLERVLECYVKFVTLCFLHVPRVTCYLFCVPLFV